MRNFLFFCCYCSWRYLIFCLDIEHTIFFYCGPKYDIFDIFFSDEEQAMASNSKDAKVKKLS